MRSLRVTQCTGKIKVHHVLHEISAKCQEITQSAIIISEIICNLYLYSKIQIYHTYIWGSEHAIRDEQH